MTNSEKYLKDGVAAKELWKAFQAYYYKNKSKESDAAKAFRNFFEEETKPTLTEDERVILRNIDKKYKYIGRADHDISMRYLYVNIENGWKPHVIEEFAHLFQFIKDGEEYSIEELLKGE